MKSFATLCTQLFAGFALFLVAAGTALANERADNFVLLDQYGKAHELHYFKNQQAIALMAYHSPMGDEAAQHLLALQTEGVATYLINSDSSDTRELIQQKAWSKDIAVLFDESQLAGERLGLDHWGETLVIDPKTWRITYRGPADKASAAVTQLRAGNAELTQIAMPSSAKSIAYNKVPVADYRSDIAPMLQEKCVSCHQLGGIGPWAMNSYEMVKGFAPMIREVVLTKRMPPWHADPHVNSFAEDISLSVEQQKTLVSWINAGTPRGEGDDPLQNAPQQNSEWVLGEPDLIIELPSFEVPATGSLDYQFFEVVNPLDHDVWVRAIQVVPGDRAVLHHAIVTFGETDNPAKPIKTAATGGTSDALTQQQLMTFVPGNEHYLYPQNTALQLPKGASIFSQMHYTTSGKVTTDTTKLGLYFSDKAPEYLLQHFSIVNAFMSIPPMEAAHKESAYFQPDKDIVVYSLFPHAHYRGRSSEFRIQYPDGRQDLLLSVPNYDFNWQRYFKLAEPLDVPAGSKIIHTTTYDNSPQSDTNPDPSATVAFGLQSWEEMLYGGISYRLKETGLQPDVPSRLQLRANVFLGSLDKNYDSKLEVTELPERMQERLGNLFGWVDANRNGGLESNELVKLFEFMAQRQQQGGGE